MPISKTPNLEERRKNALDAELCSSLDTNKLESESYAKIKSKWINNEITDDEYEILVLAL